MTKTPKKEKDAPRKEVRSKRRPNEKSQEINTPQREKRSAARRRMNSSTESAAGERFRSVTFFNNRKLGKILT